MKSYKNKNYLHEMYVNKKWSTVKLSKMHNVDPSTIHYFLRKYGICTRNISQVKIRNYVFEGNVNVVYGSLLGDGSLVKRYKCSDVASAYFIKSNIGYDHVFYVGNCILNMNPKKRIVKKFSEDGFCKGVYYKFSTLSCEFFKNGDGSAKYWYDYNIP